MATNIIFDFPQQVGNNGLQLSGIPIQANPNLVGPIDVTPVFQGISAYQRNQQIDLQKRQQALREAQLAADKEMAMMEMANDLFKNMLADTRSNVQNAQTTGQVLDNRYLKNREAQARAIERQQATQQKLLGTLDGMMGNPTASSMSQVASQMNDILYQAQLDELNDVERQNLLAIQTHIDGLNTQIAEARSKASQGTFAIDAFSLQEHYADLNKVRNGEIEYDPSLLDFRAENFVYNPKIGDAQFELGISEAIDEMIVGVNGQVESMGKNYNVVLGEQYIQNGIDVATKKLYDAMIGGGMQDARKKLIATNGNDFDLEEAIRSRVALRARENEQLNAIINPNISASNAILKDQLDQNESARNIAETKERGEQTRLNNQQSSTNAQALERERQNTARVRNAGGRSRTGGTSGRGGSRRRVQPMTNDQINDYIKSVRTTDNERANAFAILSDIRDNKIRIDQVSPLPEGAVFDIESIPFNVVTEMAEDGNWAENYSFRYGGPFDEGNLVIINNRTEKVVAEVDVLTTEQLDKSLNI